jgi:hypothetical protein
MVQLEDFLLLLNSTYYLIYCCSILAENQLVQVNGPMFRGLANLKTLSLYGNQIRSVINHEM